MTKEEQQIIECLAIPSGYATIRLGMKLHPKQAAILDALFAKPKSKVVALIANELGKTSVIGTASILYAIECRNALVVSTSATYRQIIKQLMPYIKKYANLFPDWEFLENSIKVAGETRYIGFQTTDQGRWQGWHSTPERPLYIFTDESAALADDVFQAIARCNPDYLLIAGSPLGPEGFFYSVNTEAETMKKFQHFKMTKYECTKDKGYWLDKADIDDMVQIWGRSHPLVLSSVFAEFATNIEGGIVSLAEIEACLRTPAIPDYSEGKHVAIDFSAGSDENVIAFRNGNEVKLVACWREKDTMLTAQRIVNELEILKRQYNIIESDVSGDADGLGLPIIHRIKDLGWRINQFHGNRPATDSSCRNIITDHWVNACRKIRNRSIIIPNDQILKLQLTSRKSYMNQSGKLELESKADMSSRGVPSPDRADAVCMALGQPSSGLLTFVHAPLPAPKRYAGLF